MFSIFKNIFFLNKNVNINELKKLLGSQSNIMDVQAEYSKVKIFLKSTKNIDIKKIKKLKYITGVFLTTKYIIVIVGKKAKEIKNLLLKN